MRESQWMINSFDIAQMIKQRRDSIAQYDSAGRTELSKIETDEITVINGFLLKR